MSVTMLDTSSWTAAGRQAAARDAYRASGYRLSGAELGRRFGRSGRWGRAQIQAVATEDRAAATGKRDGDDVSPVAATDGGTAAEELPPAAASKAVAPGAPSAAATGSAAAANPRRVAAAGGSTGVQRTGAAAAAAMTGSGTRAIAASRSVPAGRREVTAAAGTEPAEPDVPAAVRWASAGAVIAVASVAAVASYTHMLDLARHAGEGRLALLLPISVDGLVVAGSTTMVVRRRHGHGGGWLAWLAFSLGIGASLGANVVAADPSLVDPDVVRRVIAGWPPVALAIAAELAIELRSGGSHGPDGGASRRTEHGSAGRRCPNRAGLAA